MTKPPTTANKATNRATVNLDENKLTPNGAKFGRPKSKEPKKVTTKPMRIRLENLEMVHDLDDLISVLASYRELLEDSPRYYFLKKMFAELPDSFTTALDAQN